MGSLQSQGSSSESQHGTQRRCAQKRGPDFAIALPVHGCQCCQCVVLGLVLRYKKTAPPGGRRIWRPVLYQLSYGPRKCCGWKLATPTVRQNPLHEDLLGSLDPAPGVGRHTISEVRQLRISARHRG